MTSPPADPTVRVALDIDLDPFGVLERLRGRPGLVALVGAWHTAEAIIGFEPRRHSSNVADIDRTDGSWGWLGVWNVDGSVEIALYDHVLLFSRGHWWIESVGEAADPEPILDALATPGSSIGYALGRFDFLPSPQAHQRGVASALEHIAAGDIFQVNLCGRVEATFDGDPLDVFIRGAKELRPAYAAYVGLDNTRAIASFSPELFLRRTGRDVLCSPIKGTAGLDTDPAELEASAKNRAENVMIVDLMRNDLGRVAQPGSVRVPALTRLERHSVWHLVSDVVARLERSVTDAQLLAATFPPGSVTGAPKERAIEIARELEPSARGAYTGAIGHAGPDCGLELNVVIRTLEFAEHRVTLGVGGGIVIDSDPAEEFAECLFKAAPIVRAIGGTLDLDVPAIEPGPTSERMARAARLVDVAQGVFETVLVEDGAAVNLEAHVARLDASVRAVYGRTVRSGLASAIQAKASGQLGRHRLRVDAIPTADDVEVSLAIRPLEHEDEPWCLVPRVISGGLGEHKWVDRRVLASDDSREQLVLDDDGAVLETARASIFLVLDDGIHTPALDGRLLPGTARARVLESAAARGIPVFQRRLTLDDVAQASEMFVANALRGLVRVASVEGVGTWRAWPVADRLRNGVREPEVCPRPATQPHVLVVDNHDSFVYNLVQYTRELGATATVIRSDDPVPPIDGFTHALISPGPGTPAEAGNSAEVVRRFSPHLQVLGVCLGHQVMAELLGATVVRADAIGHRPVHGKPSLVHHDGEGIWAGLPRPLTCARYHSLVVTEVPQAVTVTARTATGLVMGLRSGLMEGVQIHPESILTSHGHAMIANFLGGSRTSKTLSE